MDGLLTAAAARQWLHAHVAAKSTRLRGQYGLRIGWKGKDIKWRQDNK